VILNSQINYCFISNWIIPTLGIDFEWWNFNVSKNKKNPLWPITHRDWPLPNWKFRCSLQHKIVSCEKKFQIDYFFHRIQVSRNFKSSKNLQSKKYWDFNFRENIFVKSRQRRRKSTNLHNVCFQGLLYYNCNQFSTFRMVLEKKLQRISFEVVKISIYDGRALSYLI